MVFVSSQGICDELEKECSLAAQYGMKGIILDGGWHADDDKRGYDFCGVTEMSRS